MDSSTTLWKIILLTGFNYIGIRHLFMYVLSDYRYTSNVIKTGVRTKGVIVGFNRKEDVDRMAQYSMIVAFIAEDEKSYTVDADNYKYVKPNINSSINLCYEKGDPANAIIDPESKTGIQLFLMTILVLAMIAFNVTIIFQLFFTIY
jgi:hypothetical protein